MENETSSAAVMRPEQAAKYLGLSVQGLANMRVDGTGPIFTKIAARVRYLKSDLDAYLAGNRRKSTQSAPLNAAA